MASFEKVNSALQFVNIMQGPSLGWADKNGYYLAILPLEKQFGQHLICFYLYYSGWPSLLAFWIGQNTENLAKYSRDFFCLTLLNKEESEYRAHCESP